MVFKVELRNDGFMETIPFEETYFVAGFDAQAAVNKVIHTFYEKNEGIILGTAIIKNINVEHIEGAFIV